MKFSFVLLRALPAIALLSAAPALASDGAPVERVLPPSNSALLLRSARGVASRLIAQVPLSPGSKIAVKAEGLGAMEQDVQDALLEALTTRQVQCVLLKPAAVDTAGSVAPPPLGPGASPSASLTPTPAPAPGDLASLSQSAAETARAESTRIAAGGTNGPAHEAVPSVGDPLDPPAGHPAAATREPMPVLSYRVLEARVDYVRQFRGGLFGAQRIERRALTSLSLRLSAPTSEAVAWTASADSAVGDVVLKSDLPSLEDRQRPETRGTVPSAGIKKVLEPLLVVVLVVGLVSLFYQNRP